MKHQQTMHLDYSLVNNCKHPKLACRDTCEVRECGRFDLNIDVLIVVILKVKNLSFLLKESIQ